MQNQYLNALCNFLGIDCNCENDGIAILNYEGRVLVFSFNPAENSYLLQYSLGSVAEIKSAFVYRKLLSANFLRLGTYGASYALDERNEEILVNYEIALTGLSVEDFLSELAKFLKITQQCKKDFKNLLSCLTDSLSKASAQTEKQDTTQWLNV